MHGRAGCVPGACGTLGPGAVRWASPGGGLPVEGSSAGSLVAALRAVQIDAAPGRPEMIRWKRGGPSFYITSVGQSRKATATCPRNVTPWLITPNFPIGSHVISWEILPLQPPYSEGHKKNTRLSIILKFCVCSSST